MAKNENQALITPNSNNFHELYPQISNEKELQDKDPKKILEEAEALKKRILEANAALFNDPYLFNQYQLFMQGKLVLRKNDPIPQGYQLASDDFIAKLDGYKDIAQKYCIIKQEAVSAGYIGQNELDNFDQSPNTNKPFHPMFQPTFEDNVDRIQNEEANLRANYNRLNNIIVSGYSERIPVYTAYYVVTGLGSLIAPLVFLPALIGGAIAQALDSLITVVSDTILSLKAYRSEKRETKRINEVTDQVNEKVNESTSNKYKQGFFSLSEAYKSIPETKIEQTKKNQPGF